MNIHSPANACSLTPPLSDRATETILEHFVHTTFCRAATLADVPERGGCRGAGRLARMLRTIAATRYVTPLREGGSLPALVEADDDGLYVLKFRGAGQGRKALVAEVVAGELARALGFLVPDLVVAALDPALRRAEPDPGVPELPLRMPG